MKKRIKETFYKYRKWLAVPVYTLAVLIIYLVRNTLIYSYLNDNLNGDVYSILFSFFAIAGFVGVVYLCTSPFRKKEFKRVCEAVSLKNNKGEYARLISVCNDPYKAHGKIYKVQNRHINMEEFEKKLSLQSANKFYIYDMKYSQNAKLTLIYIIPRKFYKPTVISDSDSLIGQLDVRKIINCLVVGSTGSGKTVAIKIIISKIVKCHPNAKIWILDYKANDFKAFSNCPHYYSYMDCVQGVNDYYAAFKEQQSKGYAEEYNYLIVDEWASFIMSLDRKTSDSLKAHLSEILMLGRSYLFIPIIGQQTAMAELYPAGARSNFKMILSMGNISKEQKSMLFSEYRDQIAENNTTGEGYLLIDGRSRLERVRFEVKDFYKLDENIIRALQQ